MQHALIIVENSVLLLLSQKFQSDISSLAPSEENRQYNSLIFFPNCTGLKVFKNN